MTELSELVQETVSSQFIVQKQHQPSEDMQEMIKKMQQYASCGKYLLAESCRLNVQKLQKKKQGKKTFAVQKKQKKQNQGVKNGLKEALTEFKTQWDLKKEKNKREGQKLKACLIQKHKKQLQTTKQRLEKQVPQKGKETSALLELRKMEISLANQRNYAQAHKIQKKIIQIQKQQQQQWLKIYNQKISQELSQLKKKQQAETKALEKRIGSKEWDLELQRTKAEAILMLKHSNLTKELEAVNKRERLVSRGQLKSVSKILSPAKSRLLSASSVRML